MKTAAGILAGGQARRFNGIAKGLLRDRRDDTIVRRLERAIRKSGLEEIVLLTNDHHSYDSLGIPILPDLRPGLGPLAAIESGLEHFASTCEAMFFVPCDLPDLTCREIRLLLDAFFKGKSEAVVAQTRAGEIQPLCAVLSVALRSEIAKQLDAGRRSVIEFLREQQIEVVVFENARPFYNINTPEDWRHWLADDAGI
jgi:molybdenum cofactor guanylyltransferase